jgi:glucose-6-phosphate dehydrogenase assembly protein OpcA
MATFTTTTTQPRLVPAARRELAHVLRRRQGLVGAESLLVLARAEGLTDREVRSLVQSWEARRWPRR